MAVIEFTSNLLGLVGAGIFLYLAFQAANTRKLVREKYKAELSSAGYSPAAVIRLLLKILQHTFFSKEKVFEDWRNTFFLSWFLFLLCAFGSWVLSMFLPS